MLVEDDVTSAVVMAETLQALGCRVTLARSGHAAIAKISEKPPDLVLLDGRMADLDGLGVLRVIRKFDGPRSRVPVVIMTGRADQAFSQLCLGAGADAVLLKPVWRDEMQVLIERYANAKHGHAD